MRGDGAVRLSADQMYVFLGGWGDMREFEMNEINIEKEEEEIESII